jgi:hypothetical protein
MFLHALLNALTMLPSVSETFVEIWKSPDVIFAIPLQALSYMKVDGGPVRLMVLRKPEGSEPVAFATPEQV